MSYLISVIMPVYHAEKTLSAALDSFLINQGNYELIMVLDGEQEECYQIASKYAADYNFIRIIYPHVRLGASKARRLGIESAQGEYCCFLDADDVLPEDALNRFEDLCDAGRVDIVNSSFYVFNHKGQKKNLFVAKERSMGRKKAFAALLGDSYIRGFLWTKMIRRDLLLGSFGPVGKDALFEDTCVTAYAFARAERFAYSPLPLYSYRKSEGDSAVSKPRVNRAAYHLAAFAMIRLYLESHAKDLLKTFYKAKRRSYWSLWYDHRCDKKFGKDKKLLKTQKKEFRAIFNPHRALNPKDTSYFAMLDPCFLPQSAQKGPTIKSH